MQCDIKKASYEQLKGPMCMMQASGHMVCDYPHQEGTFHILGVKTPPTGYNIEKGIIPPQCAPVPSTSERK